MNRSTSTLVVSVRNDRGAVFGVTSEAVPAGVVGQSAKGLVNMTFNPDE